MAKAGSFKRKGAEMKRKCKHIDITNPDTIREWVTDCIRRHKKRYDFRDMLFQYGMSQKDYDTCIEEHNNSLLPPTVEKIITEVCRQLRERSLELKPVRIREQKDKTTGKIRMIGCEPPMQQIFDYIAVYSCQDIWNSRLALQQCSSVPGRGQIYGMKMLRRYIISDNRAIRYARKHRYRYTSKCKYVVKLDVKKCFPSARLEIFMELFKHDCGNNTILWLWEQLFRTHRINGYEGFMIGSLISQWACQYMLSFIYNEAMSITYMKRGEKHRAVSHMVMFMDDMALFGSNRTQLLKAVRHLFTFAREKLGFELKPNFAIQPLGQIDMMGYVIYRKGTVSIRARNYIKARRLKLRYKGRGTLSLRQAKRLTSYKGFFVHSGYNKGGMSEAFRTAQKIISIKEKRNGKGNICRTAGKNLLPQAS